MSQKALYAECHYAECRGAGFTTHRALNQDTTVWLEQLTLVTTTKLPGGQLATLYLKLKLLQVRFEKRPLVNHTK